MSKLTNEQLKQTADHVRKYFSESDRKLVVPLFHMIKTLQDELARVEKFRQPEMIKEFRHAPSSSSVPSIFKFPEPDPNAVKFNDYLKELAIRGMTDKLQTIAKIKGLTLEALMETVR